MSASFLKLWRKVPAALIAFSVVFMSFPAQPVAAAEGDTAFPTIEIEVQGGTATPSLFFVRLTNQETSVVYDDPESENENGPFFIVPAGTYSVEVSDEDLVEDYEISFPQSGENGCDENGVLAMNSNGWDGACYVVATALEEESEDVGYMRVFTGVVNDNGGTLNADDFAVYVDDEGATVGEALTVTPGNHIVTTDAVEGYAVTYSSDCDEEGNIDVDAWMEESEFDPETDAADRCNIMFDDIAPKVTVIKHVVSQFGEDPEFNGLTASDFTLEVRNVFFEGESTSTNEIRLPGDETGTSTNELSAGYFEVRESEYIRDENGEDSEDEHGYSANFSHEDSHGEGYFCSGEIGIGEEVTCVVDNYAPLLPTETIRIKKNVINDDNGNSDAFDFLIKVHMTLGEDSHDEYIPGYENGVTVEVPVGASYTVTESPYYGQVNEITEEFEESETLHNYVASYSGACTGTIAVPQEEEEDNEEDSVQVLARNSLFIQNAAEENPEAFVCTVTNDDSEPAPQPPQNGGGGGGGGGNGVPPPTGLPPHGFADPTSGNGGGQVLGIKEDAPTTAETIATCRAEDPDTELLPLEVNAMLVRLGLSRDESSEQKYDSTLVPRILPTGVNASDRAIVRNFTTYGPNSIMYLGAGERAGVIASYVAVYGHMPQSECDWQNVLRIAKGQVPVVLSPSHELEIMKDFARIYGHDADRAQELQNVTFLIMSYGLRPRIRSLSAERQAIVIFRRKYGHNPATTREWDVMRGIAYGGLQVPGSAAIVR